MQALACQFSIYVHYPAWYNPGIILISLALCADAVIGNVQEKALKKHSASTVEMVLYSYSIGTVYILLWTFLFYQPSSTSCLELSTVPAVLLLLVLRLGWWWWWGGGGGGG